MSSNKLILLYLGIALVGSLLPVIRVFFAHFHNLVSLIISVCLEGGRKNKIKLLRDGSGQTTGSSASPLKKAILSYVGYTGALSSAIGLFYLVENGGYDFVIYLFLGLTVLALVLWIRNLFGVIWGLFITVLLALPVYYRVQTYLPAKFRYEIVLPININIEMITIHISIFLASVLFIQSIICAIKVCMQSFMSKSNPGRKAALVQTKYIPAVVLGLALVCQNLYAGYFFVQNFIGPPFNFLHGLSF